MDNFTIIYKILRALETAMDLPEFDIEEISHEKLSISRERQGRYLEMMLDSGYIKGIEIHYNILGEIDIVDRDIRITLKGLEYLTENTIMQRLYKAAKGIKDIVPGL